MTLAEQRDKLINTIVGTSYVLPAQADWLLRAISAAGFSIVADGAFEAFDLALADIARKPE